MSTDPWTDSDPQPGDFDDDVAGMEPRCIEWHEGEPGARLKIMVSVEGSDAELLEQIAEARGQRPSDVIVDLLRAADRPAA